ncbi:MAG: M50 family metallopeptidase, partial [Verrucomicrobiales bacterium]|nr:M50 family metallopeptidase [Verrucomicrobiales bacterium]
MIRFKLFGYPVTIQWMFWLMCAILGLNALSTPGQAGIIMLAILVGVVLVSILWHELGHALARKKVGSPYSEIVLHGFGGYCTGPGNFTRNQHIFVAFAGPLASFVLGGLVVLLAQSPVGGGMWVQYLIGQALWVNFGWGLMNLLPIYPLDGGQMFSAFMANK